MDSEKTVVAEGATVVIERDKSVSDDMKKEIEAAVEQDTKQSDGIVESKAGEESPPAKDKTEDSDESPVVEIEEKESDESEPEQEQGEESPDEETEEEEKPSEEVKLEASDDLLTRAIRAGMNLKDAKTIGNQDANALERQVGLLEESAQAVKKGDEDAALAEDAGKDLFAEIPELDPETYDENIIKGFSAMRSIIEKQDQTIRELSVKTNERSGSWFDNQVSQLGVKNIDSARRDALKDQFDVLKAGYVATNQNYTDEDVFKQATQLALGDELKAADDTKKTKALKKRAKLHTNRPAGPAVKPKRDASEEVAEMLDEKFFPGK